ncbi:chorismate mutase [Kangiella koreensis]|uniref:chorismate mutase n=1 Tax=Kangiella koreensis TaxID=261964 RepID=UPI00117C4CFD|nr:chorismate mutase [Kangiella koreensis]
MNSEIIQNLRSDIDELDRELMVLVEKRAQLVLRLSEEKKQLGMTDYDPTREQAIIESLYQEFKPTFSQSEIEVIFKPIFKASLRIQMDKKKPA